MPVDEACPLDLGRSSTIVELCILVLIVRILHTKDLVYLGLNRNNIWAVETGRLPRFLCSILHPSDPKWQSLRGGAEKGQPIASTLGLTLVF